MEKTVFFPLVISSGIISLCKYLQNFPKITLKNIFSFIILLGANFFTPVRFAKKTFSALSSLLFFNASAFMMRYNICIDKVFFSLCVAF